MRIEHRICIGASVDAVWGLTIDVESWPELTPTMSRVERIDAGPLAVGSRVRIKQPGQRERIWTVTEMADGRNFVWATTAMGMTMTGSHHLNAAETGTECTLTVELDGRAAQLLGPLLGRPIRRALAAENEGFKNAAERDRPFAGS